MYRAPLRDLRFVLDELLQTQALGAFPALADYSSEVGASILEEAARFAQDVLDPLNRPGDKQGARWTPEGVVAAPGFREAYRQFAVYFFDSAEQNLVPEARFTNLSSPTDLIRWLVTTQLAQQPPQAIRPGVGGISARVKPARFRPLRCAPRDPEGCRPARISASAAAFP